MKIVQMNSSHFNRILELEKLCFGNDAWSVSLFISELKSPYTYYITVLDEDDKVIGYAGCRVVFEEAELVNICVDPNCRRNGVASSILEHFAEYWKSKEIEYAFLEVRVSNAPAIRLYEKFGFVRISIRERYYGDEDAFIMMLNINKILNG